MAHFLGGIYDNALPATIRARPLARRASAFDVAYINERVNVKVVLFVDEAGLAALNISVQRAPRLVRGLDYYLRTVFEVVSPQLGEGAVICGGGRYDRLISDL